MEDCFIDSETLTSNPNPKSPEDHKITIGDRWKTISLSDYRRPQTQALKITKSFSGRSRRKETLNPKPYSPGGPEGRLIHDDEIFVASVELHLVLLRLPGA